MTREAPAPGRAVVVFAAAPIRPTPRLVARVRALTNPVVISADGGAATALAFGCQPNLVIGDFDSLPAPVLQSLIAQGVQTERHPRDKDATDGDLAVKRALAFRPTHLLLLGFVDGVRLDQTFASLGLLRRLPACTRLLNEQNEVRLLRGHQEVHWQPEPGETISLMPFNSDAKGITTTGLRWTLRNATLRFGETRGLSNEASASCVSIRLRRGRLLLVRSFSAP